MTTHETTPAKDSPDKRQRIAKLIARAGLCSRRDAEAWIVDGRVSVNGTVLTSPALDVGDDDVILVDDAPLPGIEKTRLFLFHKPRGLVTSDHDPEGRETVADYLREHWPDGPRVVTIGRLDINTEGLLLLTNDGGLARALELPATGWMRRYRVRAKGTANPADLDALAAGVTIDGIDYAGIEAKLDRVQGANSWLTMGLREGKNREIKRVLEHLGLEVNRLIRLSFGPFQLLDLPEGAVEEVRTRVLRDQLGEKLAEQAGVDFGETAPIVAPPVRDERPAGRGDRPLRGDRKGAADRGKPRAAPGRATRPPPGRTGRPARRDDKDDAPQPIRERPVAGTRRHVSALRTDGTETARKGPRKRIERTDTLDRRERTVKVERLVSARPKPTKVERPRRGQRDDARPSGRPNTEGRDRPPGDGFGPRRRDVGAEPPRGRPAGRDALPARDDRAGRTDQRRPPRRGEGRSDGSGAPRRHASPSAIGKRERMARSGAPRASGDSRNERPFGAERDARSGVETGRKGRATRPGPAGGRASAHADRRDDKRRERPADRNERRQRPAEKGGDRRPDNRPTRSGAGKPAGRPMGAASRKPNSRKPAGDGGSRPSGSRGPGRSGPPRGGPSKPRL